MAITKQQLADRPFSIGSSDAAAILAPSKWADEHKVRALKLGLMDQEDAGPKALVGTLMEPVMRELLSLHLSKPVVASTSTFTHPKHACLTANLDAFVGACKRGNPLGEFKMSGLTEGWGDEGSDQVPLPVVIQVQHQMAVTDSDETHVVRMFPDGRDWTPWHYRVPRDQVVIDGIVSTLVEWFDRHVTRKEPIPLRDRAPIYNVQRAINRDAGSVVPVDEELFRAVYNATETRKRWEKGEEEAKARFLAACGDASGGSCRLGTFVLKEQNAGRRVSVELLKANHPKVYEEVALATTSKVGRLKLSADGEAELKIAI